MPSHRVQARAPQGDARPLPIDERPDIVERFLEDAAHYPGGHAPGVAFPTNEAEVSSLCRAGRPLLAIGAQSSLTGGATPMGEVVVSTAKLAGVVALETDRVRVQPGLTLDALADVLRPSGCWFPPAPTYTGASCGGIAATNAAGAATFKYGSTRDWVRGLTVVLANGWAVQIERGEAVASADGWFEIVCGRDILRVPVRALRWPDVPKCSAGYALRDRMDLVDLLVGSEGTLGILTEITFGILPRARSRSLAFVPVADERAAIDLVHVLRDQAHASWATHGRRGVDVSAIEHVDRRSIELLREDGADRRCGVTLPSSAATVLFIEIELNDAPTQTEAWAQVAGASEADAPDTPLVRFCRLLADRGLLDDAELALPGDERRAAGFRALREAVPEAVNNRVASAKRSQPRASKIAADVIVPFERFDAMLRACHAAFHCRGLDAAIWGHISDGNVHPNVIPRSAADLASGPEAILEIGREVIRLGGSPLAEHGVGRNPIKKTLLKLLHGETGLEAMRMVKAALDPVGILAPGVLF